MGCYVNPEGMTKEEWLIAHGEATGRPAKFDERPGFLPVCLMRNPMFSAAGVAYTQGELRAFSEPDDLRPKRWYWVSTDDLKTASDIEHHSEV